MNGNSDGCRSHPPGALCRTYIQWCRSCPSDHIPGRTTCTWFQCDDRRDPEPYRTTTTEGRPMETRVSSVTNALLLCGAASGPLFILAVLVQAFTVPGFDIRVHLISLLSLGRFGFVQIANFTLCGVLNVLCAIGLWRTLHGGASGTLAPVLIGLHGLLLVVVGVFVTDPVNGFSPGAVTPATP